MNSSKPSLSSYNSDRRYYIKTAGLGVMAMTFPLPLIPDFLRNVPMGIVVHSYAARWHSDTPSENYPGFENALSLIEHCKEIGAGGVQTLVNGWSSDFAKKVRDAREKTGLYMEGSISLPKSKDEIAKFEAEVLAAKEAGATVLRTACLSGRRYVTFKTLGDYEAFRTKAIESIELAEPIVRKHNMKLAVENHKDWTAKELEAIIKKLGSEWVGVTLDFGNNLSFMENPMEVIETLAPYAFSTHVKDMGVKNYPEGFLLSEVPLGEGIVDLKSAVELCKKYNPEINFSLEMITRDPLEIPVMKDSYWATFDHLSGLDVYRMERLMEENQFKGELPHVTGLSKEEQLAYEEKNVLACLEYSRILLG
ncbi:sugar phosphate isomerase/epimerase family protein [Algoriphagus yeomjeoni]|uniref:Sugar phosphate isomerase/epimerase n=1 Tax=Algoriphagus yeomjeoni TaxID=291403 RepID=A0A327PHX8_9BACT|nr:sugar phosphate isomerase/epimerase family protein [Algoriphagus yeomjeoni]RAI89326.1 sugar phosphate isomerase/epimerase [Algoriphagus yeomjeoni]